MQCVAYCPECKKAVSDAVLVPGSPENLQRGEGDVFLAHYVQDPLVGEHRWRVTDPDELTRLRNLLRRQA